MRRGRIALAVAVLALVLGTAACQKPDTGSGIATAGGATPNAGSGAATGSGALDEAGWVKCLRDQGVEVSYPDPQVGTKPQLDERSVAPGKLSAALRACQRFNPNWGKPPPPMDRATLERWRQFARCMRANGVNWPDPQPGDVRPREPESPGDGSGTPDRSGRNQVADNQATNAMDTCSKQVPGLMTISNDGAKGDKK
jgi:hypothetical protein